MSTIRVTKRERWTTISRETLNDEALSFRARGVLAWLLDKPDDWRCNADTISNHGTEGRDAVRTALSELEEHGYLVRRKAQDAQGRWSTEIEVYERPTDAWKSVVGSPTPGNPTVGSPGANTTTETDDCEQTPVVPIDSDFEMFWKWYPNKVGKPAARRAWQTAVKRSGVEPIFAGGDRWRDHWKAAKTEQRYIPHPATFLNQERYNDTPPKTKASGSMDTLRRLAGGELG